MNYNSTIAAGARNRQNRERRARPAKRRIFFDPLSFPRAARKHVRLMCFPFFFPPVAFAAANTWTCQSSVAIIVDIMITLVFVIWLSLLPAVTVIHCRRRFSTRSDVSKGRTRRSSHCQHFATRRFRSHANVIETCKIQAGTVRRTCEHLLRTWHGLIMINLWSRYICV